jgi:hypothetical protein
MRLTALRQWTKKPFLACNKMLATSMISPMQSTGGVRAAASARPTPLAAGEEAKSRLALAVLFWPREVDMHVRLLKGKFID